MRRPYSLFFLIMLLVAVASPVHAQVVVPGGSIKPEGGGGEAPTPEGQAPRKKRRAAPAASVVKSGESFMIQMATVLSSGLTKPGETVYFTAAEDVGKGRPVINSGAVGKGTVKEVTADKKKGNLVVSLDSIVAVNGESVSLGGDVSVEGQGGQAAVAVGDRFTATLDEKVVVRGRSKKPEEIFVDKKASAEIIGKGVKADIKKGSVKGKVEVLIEAPRGMSLDDVNNTSVVLYRVNNFTIPNPVPLSGAKVKTGDRNKNGIPDIALAIGAWDFIKYQPRGNNTVTFRGRLKNGEPFEATSGVSVDY
jgi:hypothetical protein